MTNIKNRRLGQFVSLSLIVSGVLSVACGGGDNSSGQGSALGGAGGTPDTLENKGSGGASSGGGQAASGGGSGLSNNQPEGLIWPVDTSPIESIDLLFVVDNSVSMGDKQALLKKAVPKMVERLINPPCVDPDGLNPENNTGSCPQGKAPAFPAVDDIHLGIISSSLGGHGSASCPRDGTFNGEPQHYDDRGRLMPSVRTMSSSADPDGTGFLAWNGGDTSAQSDLVAAFEEQIAAVRDTGCGYEAPLEAFYRFLVDPTPPQDIVVGNTNRADAARDTDGNVLVDQTLLAQRQAFLRPNGFVAIVLLTDENDCSAMDGGSYYNNAGFGYLTADPSFNMPVATSVCEQNPNDACCFSCMQSGDAPAGCEAAAAEVCSGSGPRLTSSEDRVNVRCFDQKRRFGLDLLYPVQRYVDALTKQQIVDARTGDLVDNPLLLGTDGQRPEKGRDPGRVVFMGLTGVPWQDIASPQSLSDASTLRFLTAEEMRAKNVNAGGKLVDRWAVILGEPNLAAHSKACADSADPRCGKQPVAPLDPFMVSSIEQRTIGASNPITGDKIVASTSNDPYANNINGHEADHSKVDSAYGLGNDDLQYSCIFELENFLDSYDCATSASCDCAGEPSRNRPVCQSPQGGAAESAQYFGKAYPSPRILQVIRDVGDTGVIGSICPKTAKGDSTSQSYGYNAAVDALVHELGLRVDQALDQ